MLSLFITSWSQVWSYNTQLLNVSYFQIRESLDQTATSVFKYNLNRILDSAIRGSNAQFDDPEILDRLDICAIVIQHSFWLLTNFQIRFIILLHLIYWWKRAFFFYVYIKKKESSEDLKGWDVFSLDYILAPPLSGIFTQQTMDQYLTMFIFLFKVKRVEHCLSAFFKKNLIENRLYFLKQRNENMREMHQRHGLVKEMTHFIRNLQYYLNFEVIESAWEEFSKSLQQLNDLDEILNSHSRYLREITTKAFIHSKDISSTLSTVLELIISFSTQTTLSEDLLVFHQRYRKETAKLFSLLKRTETARFLVYRLDFNSFYGRHLPRNWVFPLSLFWWKLKNKNRRCFPINFFFFI